jgi:hypothetical protein
MGLTSTIPTSMGCEFRFTILAGVRMSRGHGVGVYLLAFFSVVNYSIGEDLWACANHQDFPSVVHSRLMAFQVFGVHNGCLNVGQSLSTVYGYPSM